MPDWWSVLGGWCVSARRAMLAQVPEDPRLVRVRASAEQVTAGQTVLPERRYDAVLVKKAIHHDAVSA